MKKVKEILKPRMERCMLDKGFPEEREKPGRGPRMRGGKGGNFLQKLDDICPDEAAAEEAKTCIEGVKEEFKEEIKKRREERQGGSNGRRGGGNGRGRRFGQKSQNGGKRQGRREKVQQCFEEHLTNQNCASALLEQKLAVCQCAEEVLPDVKSEIENALESCGGSEQSERPSVAQMIAHHCMPRKGRGKGKGKGKGRGRGKGEGKGKGNGKGKGSGRGGRRGGRRGGN